MIFNLGPSEHIYSSSIILTAVVQLTFEIKNSIQITAKGFKGFNNLCIRKFLVFFKKFSSLVRFRCLVCADTDFIVFDFFINLQEFFC